MAVHNGINPKEIARRDIINAIAWEFAQDGYVMPYFEEDEEIPD